MTERLKPTINRILFISEEDLQAMESWPLELRAIFDPRAEVELAKRERRPGKRLRKDGPECEKNMGMTYLFEAAFIFDGLGDALFTVEKMTTSK